MFPPARSHRGVAGTTAGHDVPIKGNLGADNVGGDADDQAVSCGSNVWSSDMFGTAADACIE